MNLPAGWTLIDDYAEADGSHVYICEHEGTSHQRREVWVSSDQDAQNIVTEALSA